MKIALSGAVLLLAACSSQAPPRFHSLLPPLAGAAAAPGAVLPVLPAWQLLPVTIPAQVDQPQFVVRRADDTLAVLEQERWIAPLNDEIRAALAEHLTAALGAPGAAPAAGRKDWRIEVDVHRFDSTPGRSTLVAQWTLLAGGDTPALRCRSVHEQSVGAGAAALAAGHRQAVGRLGVSIAQALAALDAGRAASCPRLPS
ncbi:MAG: PqiC family protein [Burkholderiaceae bacterium]